MLTGVCVVCSLLSVVCWLRFAARCLLFVACVFNGLLLLVVRCVLSVVRCLVLMCLVVVCSCLCLLIVV